MTIFAGIAEFERDLIRERAGAGRADAQKCGGPPRHGSSLYLCGDFPRWLRRQHPNHLRCNIRIAWFHAVHSIFARFPTAVALRASRAGRSPNERSCGHHGGIHFFQRPGATSAFQLFSYMTRAIVCTMAISALSTLLACLLDEMWQFSGAVLCCIALFLLQSRFDVVSRISPFRGMSLISYPVTAPMPWAPALTSLVQTGGLLYASMLILQRKEY